MARRILKGKGLPKKFWVEAINTAAYILNRSPTKAVQNQTLFETWYKRKPDVSHLKVFNSIAYAFIPSQSRDKFDEKREKLIFISYNDESKGFQLFNPKKDQILFSKDIIFMNLLLGNGKIQSIQNQQHWSYLKL